MKLFVVFALISTAAGTRLDHFPQAPRNAADSDGSVVVDAPGFGAGSSSISSSPAYGTQYQRPGGNGASIVRFSNEPTDNGWRYSFEGSDGTKAEQQGQVLPGATAESGSLAVQGSFSYVGTDGNTYSITYTADENGYQPHGSHLPTPPPVPEAIARALSGQLNQQRSSSETVQPTSYHY